MKRGTIHNQGLVVWSEQWLAPFGALTRTATRCAVVSSTSLTMVHGIIELHCCRTKRTIVPWEDLA